MFPSVTARVAHTPVSCAVCAAFTDICPLCLLHKDTNFPLKQSLGSFWTIIYLLVNAVSWEEGEGARKIICEFGSCVVFTLIQINFF